MQLPSGGSGARFRGSARHFIERRLQLISVFDGPEGVRAMDQVSVIEAYSRLKALKEHVPGPYVHPKYVTEFHEILGLLEQVSGANLASFRIPATEIKPVITSVSYIGEGANYSDDPYCDRSFFDMKVDGVLTMFELLMSSDTERKGPIGFNANKK